MFDPFDLNRDGKLDLMEGFLKYQMIMGEDEEDDEVEELFDLDEDEDDEDEDEDEEDEEEDKEAELEYELSINGLDRIDLECMDEDERRGAIEDAGLDPDDYEDLFF